MAQIILDTQHFRKTCTSSLTMLLKSLCPIVTGSFFLMVSCYMLSINVCVLYCYGDSLIFQSLDITLQVVLLCLLTDSEFYFVMLVAYFSFSLLNEITKGECVKKWMETNWSNVVSLYFMSNQKGHNQLAVMIVRLFPYYQSKHVHARHRLALLWHLFTSQLCRTSSYFWLFFPLVVHRNIYALTINRSIP